MPKFFVDQYLNETLADRLKNIKDLKYSEDDVMLCSFAKTGTHWTTNLLSLLFYDGPMETSSSFKTRCVDVVDSLEEISALPSPKVFNTHLRPNRFQADIVVAFGPYSDYLKSFENKIKNNTGNKIHVMYYEDLKQNSLEEMRKIQKCLGFNHGDERLQAIIDRCSINKLRDDVIAGRTKATIRDREGKSVGYRKGEIGDWKNYFTVAESEAFDAAWEAEMKDSMFNFRYT